MDNQTSVFATISPDRRAKGSGMIRLATTILALMLFSAPVLAQGGCEACRAEDEQQIGNHVEREDALPRSPKLPDPRGEALPVPVPTPVGPATVRVKPGSGLWLGSPGEGMGNVFLNGTRDKASVGWRLGF